MQSRRSPAFNGVSILWRRAMLKLMKQAVRAAPPGWLLGCALLVLPVVTANAQQITGTPGSPSATTTIEGNQVPPPPQKFEGKIERNAAQSTPWWPARVVPPKGAPNILLIMTDDTDFGVTTTFGGVIPRSDRRQRTALHQL